MGMSTHVVGFRPPDKKWNEMLAIWKACNKAEIPVPNEVVRFFDHECPLNKPGIEVDIRNAVSDWEDESRQGFEVDVTKLPPDLKIVRFFNAW